MMIFGSPNAAALTIRRNLFATPNLNIFSSRDDPIDLSRVKCISEVVQCEIFILRFNVSLCHRSERPAISLETVVHLMYELRVPH